MKKIFTILLFIFIGLNGFSQVRISQVYGGGGQAGGTYDHDFVELFNAGTAPADISNWSIQYASAGGSAWSVAAIPAATSIAAGKYFLVSLATGGAVGVPLPAPDLSNSGINISNTAGKLALVNSTTALSGTTACNDASVVDVIGYGAAATCSETANAVTTGIDNTLSQFRGANGCTDNNNNSTDFSIAAVSPRNSATAANSCGPGTAFLTAAPATLNMNTSFGIISIEQTFILSGGNLSGFPGNISVTASAGLQVSLTSGSGFASSINVPYTSPSLSATTIFVRISASAPQGALNGTITNSGGSATDAIVTVTGGVYQDYYNTKANLGVNNTGTWSTTTDGTGPSPSNFTGAFQVFNIINQANASYSGIWDVPGDGSRVVVGDGVAAVNFTVFAGADSLTMATKVNVLNNATLTLLNNRRPFLNNLATGSTVDFAQTGTTTDDTIRIPNISFYNLKLTNGLKYFSPNTTTIRGDLTADAVVSMNGSSGVFSTINALGNVNFINNPHFEPLPTGDAGRITLAMNGGGTQSINAGNLDSIYFFRLQRDTTSSNSFIDFTSGNLFLGNNAGGGLRLNQGISTTTILNMDVLSWMYFIGAGNITSSANGKIRPSGGSISMSKSTGNGNGGTLRIDNSVAGPLSELQINFASGFTRDSLMIADTLELVRLNMINGRAVVAPSAVLTIVEGPVVNSSAVVGGGPTSFIDGKLRLKEVPHGAPNIIPLGKGSYYAPMALQLSRGDFTVQYFHNDYGDHTIDPLTLASFPLYNISYHEYWVIDKDPASTISSQLVRFYYNDVRSGVIDFTQLRAAHFDGTDWDDLGAGTPVPGNTATDGYLEFPGITTFSPFTFSATTSGVLPVRMSSFTVKKMNEKVNISWTTEQEINSSHFIVQRSADGRKWNDIATVNAAGNSNSTISYFITDNTPLKGINYYRLKQVDINNRTELSLVRTVFFSSEFDFTINPNPARDYLNILIAKNNNTVSTITVRDINGKSILNATTADAAKLLDIQKFPAGIYFITVINESLAKTKKLIVQ